MAGTSLQTPRPKRRSKSRKAETEMKAPPATPTASERKRRRASDFASKKPSARKRKRRTEEESEEPDVDQMIMQLRGIVENDDDDNRNADLRKALLRAKKASQSFESGSSSESEGAGGAEKGSRKSARKAARNKPTEKEHGTGDALTKGKQGTPKKANASKAIAENGFNTPPAKRTAAALELRTPQTLAKAAPKGGKSSVKKKRTRNGGREQRHISKTASAHKADIEALKQDDPEFYKFLEETDATLLQFGDSDDDLLVQDISKEEEEHDGVSESAEEDDDDSSESDEPEIAPDAASDDNPDEAPKSRDNRVAENDCSESDIEEDDSDCEASNQKSGDLKGRKSPNPGNKKPVVEQVREQGTPRGSDDEGIDGSSAEESDSEDEVVNKLQETDADAEGHEGGVADIEGYSGDSSDDSSEDETEALAEAEAAAEAGLDVVVDGDSSSHSSDEMEVEEASDDSGKTEDHAAKEPKKAILVDMAYLRQIVERLKSNRSCLKAAKDLLRLFRAGRDILPAGMVGVEKKDKLNKKKVRKAAQNEGQGEGPLDEVDEGLFTDDGSFTSGQVKFASAKAYQHAMNLAITGIQDALDRMLGKEQPRKAPSASSQQKWDPSESNRWKNLQPVFRPFVYHLVSLCDSMTDAKTMRFLLKRLERLIPYTKESKELVPKIIRIAINAWSSDALHMSEATRLRAYLLLNKLAHGPGNAEAVLRSCCNVYASKIAAVCNPRTLPKILFATTCIVELFGVDMSASYTTAFANLREMAVALRAVLVSKHEKEEVERLHNWSYINRLRLWSKVLGRYGSEDELRPLIYPFVQVSLGVMRVYATPRTFPMRLHVALYLSDLIAKSGTFIPLTPHLLLLLRCSELRKKPAHGSSKAIEWRSVLRVSDEVVKTKPFLSGVVNGVVFQLAKFFATISKHVSFPELSFAAETSLRKFAKEVQVPEWKGKVMALVEKLQQTSKLVADARARSDFAPHGAISPEGMLAIVPGLDRDLKTPMQRYYEVEINRISKEEKMRDATVAEKDTTSSDHLGEELSGSDTDGEPSHPKPKKHPAQQKKKKVELAILKSDDEDEEDQIEELSIDSDSDE